MIPHVDVERQVSEPGKFLAHTHNMHEQPTAAEPPAAAPAAEQAAEQAVAPQTGLAVDDAGPRLHEGIQTNTFRTAEALRKFLDAAPPSVLDYKNFMGQSAIHLAVNNDSNQRTKPVMTKVLIERGCDIEARTGDDRTPLMMAAGSGSLQVVEMLLAAGASVNATTAQGDTALTQSISFPRVLQRLIDAGADRSITKDGMTPLEQAKVPIGTLAKERAQSAAILHEYEQQDLIARVAERRAAGRDANALSRALWEACKSGDEAEVTSLLADDAQEGEAVEAMLRWKEADKKRSCLWAACQKGKTGCAALLLDAGAPCDDADADGCTPLIAACQYGHAGCAELLVARGADLHAATARGFTPLLTAIYHRQHGLAQWLLARPGARTDVKAQGKTALDWAKTVARVAPVATAAS